jgi:CelD/BcsL family acetyltransferase involved in cellulose biosynthesis
MSEPRIGPAVPLPPGVYLRRPAARLPFPLEERGCSLFARARHGLWQGVQALGLGGGDGVLVPAYHHGSEVEALVAAGLRPRFYEGTADLEPDADELQALLDGDTRALYLIHYLGFPQDTVRWRAWCDERGLLLIEDAAQAWLARVGGRPVGSDGDLAIFCLYKMFGVPDGGAVLVGRAGRPLTQAPPGPDDAAASGAFAALRRHAAWALQHSAPLAAAHRRADRSNPYDPTQDFGLGNPGEPPSLATQRLLRRIVDERTPSSRRANHEMLLEELAELAPRPFDRVPAGASPFAFPIEVDDRREVLGRLAARGVDGIAFWSVPHPTLPEAQFPAARRRRDRTIALPVHQELRPADVERVAAAARGHGRLHRQLRLEPVESLGELEPEWRRLAERTGNVFSSWEWASVWWRHFAGRRALRLFRVRSAEGRIVAILPLYVFSRHPHVVRFVGHGAADELGPLCAPADRPAAARGLRRALDRLGADVLLAERLPGDAAWSSLLGGRLLSREGSPVIDLRDTTWDTLMAGWSGNMRTQIRRSERRLEREHGLRFRRATAPERLEEELDRLFDLYAACRQDTHSEFARAHQAFHREFAGVALDRGWLRLWFLEADGDAVAAQLVYRFAGTDAYYQSGRSPAWQRQSVGTVLMAHTIRDALAGGVREYRLLRGQESYKYRLASHDPGLETVALSSRRLPDAALAVSRALPERLAVHVRRRIA